MSEKRGVSNVVKRDSSVVAFEKNKIETAVKKAALSVGKNEDKAEQIGKEVARIVAKELEKRFISKAPDVENVQDAVEKALMESYPDIAKSFILYRQQRHEVREMKKFYGVKDDMKLSVNAIKILEARYLLKDNEGNVIETPREMFRRVAKAVAFVEKKSDREKYEKEFYEMMANQEFLPNSPTLMNAGTELGQLSACFVIPVNDSLEEIFDAVKAMALIQQSGGGTGFAFSRLRPKGDIVKSTKGVASGPISFMRVFDTATEVIKQGGRRRGANMGILRADHPDIVDFVNCKSEEGKFSNFNLSVGATESFMQAVQKNEKFEIINPRSGKAEEKINAKSLFELIISNAWRTGDPGMIFLDEINRKNLVPKLGKIESTNPCVTKDNWIMTSEGPRQVYELINKRFSAAIGSTLILSKQGFFKTGNKQVYRLKTKEGFEVKLTPEHKVSKIKKLTRHKIETKWAEASNLRKGDKILINNHKNLKWGGEYGKDEGYLIGLLLGDGTIKKDKTLLCSWGDSKGPKSVRETTYQILNKSPHRSDFKGWMLVKARNEYRLSTVYLKKLAEKLGLNPRNKVITERIEKASSDFYRGFVSGFFDTDGCVIGNQKKGVSVRLAQSNLGTLKAVQRMLLRLGIFSKIYQNRRKASKRKLPDGRGGLKEYNTKPQHELVITNANLVKFYEKIGFKDIEKQEKLKKAIKNYKRKTNAERFIATIDKIIPCGKEEVFDVQIPGKNAFDANGFVVHNCGEQPLLPYESCNLGSINLSKMAEGKTISWVKLKRTVRRAVRFLDNVIDANKYTLKQIENNTKRTRKIGLGVMGFAEMLIKLGIPYDSEIALNTAERLMKFITKEARTASEEIGEEKGSFPAFKLSRLANYKAMRNTTVTTIAPTGTISIIAGCSSGIEPLFAVSFIRNVLEGTKMLEINSLFEETAKLRKIHSKEIMMKIAENGSLQEIAGIPEDIKRIFKTALDIAPEWHVRMQAAFQQHTDNAVSKTVNLPYDATIDDIRKIYLLAHQLRCKGITVYRYGSKKEQVLYTGQALTKELGETRHVRAESDYAGGCPTIYCPF
jgi:ribonucleoside-diphosphate reductase alpha chain